MKYWRFAVTLKGRIGPIPSHSKEGNGPSILLGGNLTFVVRAAREETMKNNIDLFEIAISIEIMNGECFPTDDCNVQRAYPE